MTNKLKGEAALILEDGRRFTLVLDFDGWIDAEGVYGKPLQQLKRDASAGFMGAFRAMLYAATRRHHPKLTLGDASLIVRDHLEEVALALIAAIEASEPQAAEGDTSGNAAEEAEADPDSPPAGTSSGDSGAKPD